MLQVQVINKINEKHDLKLNKRTTWSQERRTDPQGVNKTRLQTKASHIWTTTVTISKLRQRTRTMKHVQAIRGIFTSPGLTNRDKQDIAERYHKTDYQLMPTQSGSRCNISVRVKSEVFTNCNPDLILIFIPGWKQVSICRQSRNKTVKKKLTIWMWTLRNSSISLSIMADMHSLV